MRRPIAALAIAATALASAPAVMGQEAPGRLLTVITSAEPQTQLMALILTNASVQKGAEAQVLLCGPGGDLGLAEPPNAATAPLKPRGLSPQGLLVRLMEAGVPVEVCAIYLPNLGAGPEALLEGVGTAMPPAIAEVMLDPATRIFSF